MLTITSAFSGFSVNNLAKATEFYGTILGLKVEDNGMGLKIILPVGGMVFAYAKPDHQPATFTILNFEVEDIEKAVDDLIAQGVTFERYENFPFKQDEKGIAWGKKVNMGPNIAWFKDPAGNILSIIG
jgi:catechol 2,3-dioxygenase-like lactoylglutathione lyase family enzyme